MPTQKELLIELRDKQIAKHGKDAPSVKALQQQINSASRVSPVTRLAIKLQKK
jgi:hypothetical protein